MISFSLILAYGISISTFGESAQACTASRQKPTVTTMKTTHMMIRFTNIVIANTSSVQQTADLFQQPESKQNNDKHRETVQASPMAAAGGAGRTGSGHIPEDLIPNEMLPGTRMAVAIEIEHTHESSPSKIVGRSVLLPHLYHTIRRSDNTGSVLQHSTCYFAACGKPVNFHLPEVTSCSRHPHYPKLDAVKMQHLQKAAKKRPSLHGRKWSGRNRPPRSTALYSQIM